MWESRVLGEISKFLWAPLLGFHRNVISTPSSSARPVLETRIRGRLSPYRRADRRSFSETASVCQAPVLLRILLFPVFSEDFTQQQLRSEASCRRAGPPQERGPRRRPSSQRSSVVSTENVKSRVFVFVTFSTSQWESVQFVRGRSARSCHPSLRALGGAPGYAGA